ncbi:MAG: type 1 glutamine amidotransferase [Actinomycetota bacterium]
MKPIVLARNDAFETFGVAVQALEAAGAPVVIWDAIGGHPGPALDDVGGLVVFGSTFNVEHADEQPFIGEVAGLAREAVQRGVPYLGVCFGAQLLAWALGSEVIKAPVREVGFEPIRPLPAADEDRLVSHYDDGDVVFQWHMDTFDLPHGAELLAKGDGVAHQAFRVGDTAWGLQWHFEIDAPELRSWLDSYQQEGGDLLADWGKSRVQVEREAEQHIASHERKGAEVFQRFARVARQTR